MNFRVWAPFARRADLVVGEEPVAMIAVGGGWWEAEVGWAAAGTDYAYSLDGGPARPDPRSPWQPEGVHGPSRVVDHSAFAWTDEAWGGFHLPSAVLYELHVGTFTPDGTFRAAIEHLDHIVDLGVTAVELLPVNAFPGAHGWGYDGVGLFAPHAPYGGPDGLKALVDACHRRGLGVILDVVYNHLGPAGNHLGEYGPYFTDRYVTPWGQAVNLDGGGSEEVRRFFIDNALGWLRDHHIDGLRIDAVHAIVDTSATHLLEELVVEVARLADATGRPRWLIAESELNDPRLITSREAGGYGLDASWSDDFHHAVHALLTGERSGYYEDFGAVDDLLAALTEGYVYAGRHSAHRRRRHGRALPDVPATRLLGYAQNHDQVGNRATGERLAHLVDDGLARVAAALVLTAPFVPMLFHGEEWGASTPFQYFTDHDDPELGRAVSEGRRREFAAFGWSPDDVPDPQDPATFERSKLRWDEIERDPHASLLAWHRALIALRHAEPDLSDGRFVSAAGWDADAGWLRVERGALTVELNLSDQLRRDHTADGDLVLASHDDAALGPDGLALPPRSVAILRRTS
ncbi:malto-oligosyltrehalose trehalohydrolase [soil metagenome]